MSKYRNALADSDNYEPLKLKNADTDHERAKIDGKKALNTKPVQVKR